MILTGITLDAYADCHDLRLTELSHGLNVVYGVPGSGKTTLAKYIRHTLFGFQPSVPVGHGCLAAVVNAMPCRLSRTAESDRQLVVADVRGFRAHGSCEQTLQTALQEVGADAFDITFCVDGRRDSSVIPAISELIQRRFNVPRDRFSATGNRTTYVSDTTAEPLGDRILRLAARIVELERQCDRLNEQVAADEREKQHRRLPLEEEVRTLASEITVLEGHTFCSQIESLDRQITESRLQLEKETQPTAHPDAVPVPTAGYLELRYQRLDETEDQVRRWKNLLHDVQAQRVALKDEMVSWKNMTIDSSSHPYHRSSEIISSLQNGVESAEDSLTCLRESPGSDGKEVLQCTEKLAELCNLVRAGLTELCGELGRQYTTIRHRAGAAELKRLRGCYDEVEQNVERLLTRRVEIIQQIREFDPEGAAAIERSEATFSQFALQHGFFQARCRFVGDIADREDTPPVPHHDTVGLQRRLIDLENQRASLVRDLVANENRLSQLKVRRQAIIDELQGLSKSSICEDLCRQREQIHRELRDCRHEHERLVSEDRQRPRWTDGRAERMLRHAVELTRRLTCGQIEKIWLTCTGPADAPLFDVEVQDRYGHQYSSAALSPIVCQQLGLALSLAFVGTANQVGPPLPLILDDVFVNLNPELIRATLNVISEFCEQGNQAIVLTADRSVVPMARQQRAAVFDLPETSVSPQEPAWWAPDRATFAPPRQPEFLTPFTTRSTSSFAEPSLGYPLVKYPPTDNRIDHAVENFDSYSVFTPHDEVAQPARQPDSAIRLEQLGIIDSIDLDRLRRLGIHRMEQLLKVDPQRLPAEFCDSHLSTSQIANWQSQIELLQSVPVLRPAEAQILVALGIREPEQLDRTSPSQMYERVLRYLQTADGQRFNSMQLDWEPGRIDQWYESLERTRPQWQRDRGIGLRDREDQSATARRPYSVFKQEPAAHRERPVAIDRPLRQEARGRRPRPQPIESPRVAPVTKSRPPSNRSEKTAVPSLKFHLDLSSDLEAAPAIGPKTAERFAKINIQTVGEFLQQTAEAMASRINYKRISANVILQWQHQARLVCRIPNLRGHDAQLLVACGIVEPEDLATRNADKLFEIIEPFSESKEGLKIIRGGKKPDLEEVTNWIHWAQQTRSIQAA